MSTLIVEVCEIQKVEKHSNADSLELAQIKGWQCVVPKGKFQPGQKIVYVPVDSLMTTELSDKIGVTKYLSNGRVRCAKLRGEPSFGVIMDPADPTWELGRDVKEFYNITKYIPPIKITCGDAETPHGLLSKYTEIENMRNFPDVFESDEEIVMTEKVHGTNCKIAIIDGLEMAASMDVRRKRPEGSYEDMKGNIYWSPFAIPEVRELLACLNMGDHNVIIYGEVYGTKIQTLGYGKTNGSLGFSAFDIMIEGKYLDFVDFEAICAKFGVTIAPVIARGKFSLDFVKANAGGKTTMGADHIREGVVVRPIKERIHPKIGRVILKYISDEYLLMKDGGKISDSQDA